MADVVFFAPDRAEIAQIRRIRHYRRAGHRVSSFSMCKKDGQVTTRPDWPDIDLGEIENENLPKRLLLALLGLRHVWRHRQTLRGADLIVARNIDMVVLAFLARILCWAKAPILYECLDIHSIFTNGGSKTRIARWVERKMLSRCALLVVSSPGFISQYFTMIQGYTGPWELLENKIVFEAGPVSRQKTGTCDEGPVVLGWVGTIRCPDSLRILAETAVALPDDVMIRISGIVHHHALPDFDSVIAGLANVEFTGPYDYPSGLNEVYANCDLVWAQDLWQRGANSQWLLPNRIYEASWFGCPSVAVEGTQTATAVSEMNLGFNIPQATPHALIDFLRSVKRLEIESVSKGLIARPDDAFCLTDEDINRVVRAAIGDQPKHKRA